MGEETRDRFKVFLGLAPSKAYRQGVITKVFQTQRRNLPFISFPGWCQACSLSKPVFVLAVPALCTLRQAGGEIKAPTADAFEDWSLSLPQIFTQLHIPLQRPRPSSWRAGLMVTYGWPMWNCKPSLQTGSFWRTRWCATTNFFYTRKNQEMPET